MCEGGHKVTMRCRGVILSYSAHCQSILLKDRKDTQFSSKCHFSANITLRDCHVLTWNGTRWEKKAHIRVMTSPFTPGRNADSEMFYHTYNCFSEDLPPFLFMTYSSLHLLIHQMLSRVPDTLVNMLMSSLGVRNAFNWSNLTPPLLFVTWIWPLFSEDENQAQGTCLSPCQGSRVQIPFIKRKEF